uniref:Uncharacterized protein n=1 Tax=Arundo donax TaxID=35708 RepID=A0A0A9HAA4_ARUDO
MALTTLSPVPIAPPRSRRSTAVFLPLPLPLPFFPLNRFLRRIPPYLQCATALFSSLQVRHRPPVLVATRQPSPA